MKVDSLNKQAKYLEGIANKIVEKGYEQNFVRFFSQGIIEDFAILFKHRYSEHLFHYENNLFQRKSNFFEIREDVTFLKIFILNYIAELGNKPIIFFS